MHDDNGIHGTAQAEVLMNKRSPLDEVDAILSEYSAPSAALSALRAGISLPALAASIRADPSRRARIVQRSYQHKNGFDKIVLAAPPGSPLKLVLHVWREGRSGGEDNIHNHRWDFASLVLCGALKFEFYVPDQSGVTYPVVRYRSPEGGEAYELSPAGSAAVSVRASMTLASGTFYRWNADLLHRAWGVSGQTTATLIVQGSSVREETTVLVRDASLAPDARQSVEPVGEAALRSSLDVLAAADVQSRWAERAV